MSVGLLILALVGAAVVAWWLFKVFLGFAVPEKVSGAALLKEELQKRGVPTERLPQQFYDECVEFASAVADVEGMVRRSRLARKGEFVKSIENLATMVSWWREDPKDSMFNLR